MTHNEISRIIIDAAMEIHTKLGPGLLEIVYRKILAHELRKRGLRVEEEWPIPVDWDGFRIEPVGYRMDLLAESKVMVELKSVEKITPVFKKTLNTCLRLGDKRLGMLINFGAEHLRDGISRVVNGLVEED